VEDEPRGQPTAKWRVKEVAGAQATSRRPRFRKTNEEIQMSKLLTMIVAATFAVVSASAFAASHAGAQMKDEKKMDKKEGKMKKGEGKKTDGKKKAASKKKAEDKK
jgi:hypothetical protein